MAEVMRCNDVKGIAGTGAREFHTMVRNKAATQRQHAAQTQGESVGANAKALAAVVMAAKADLVNVFSSVALPAPGMF